MHLKVVFKRKTIILHLFDEPVIRRWFKYYKNYRSANYRALSRRIGTRIPYDENHWKNIMRSFERLKDMDFKVPGAFNSEFDRKQDTLNYLHRFFTYNVTWFYDNQNQPCVNEYDHAFTVPDHVTFQSWLDLIDVINVSVHELELMIEPTANKKFIAEHVPLETILIRTIRDTHSDVSPWLHFNDIEIENNFKYFDHDLDLVLLDESICGKCVLQSFCDDDDVNAKDCTGRLGSLGGFMFDLNRNRKKIYTSSRFNDWINAQDRSLGSLPLEFPIGYIEDLDTLAPWLRSNLHTFETVEFLD